jgi:hypothetical protein
MIEAAAPRRAQATIGASYTGQFAGGTVGHGVKDRFALEP